MNENSITSFIKFILFQFLIPFIHNLRKIYNLTAEPYNFPKPKGTENDYY